MTDISGKRVLVVGMGSSGEAATRVLLERGARPVLIDRSESPSRADLAAGLREAGAEVRLGVEVPEDIESFEMVVVSPGVPDRSPVLERARGLGTEVISELEFGFRLLEGLTLVAITGTNGKTTTTALLASVLDRPGRGAHACGNIGAPIVSLAGRARSGEVLVCEVSSFQLQNIKSFRPDVAIALNLAPDHFDWHEGMADYAAAKARIVRNMGDDGFLVYNAEDEFCVRLAASTEAEAIGFSRTGYRAAALRVAGGVIETGPPFREGALLDVGSLSIVGSHNLDNVMAAAGAALALGEDRETVAEAITRFEGLEHRCEPAGTVQNVEFFNDSKATNPHASLHAVASFEGPFVVIAGGRNKGLEFSELAGAFCERMADGALAGLVLLGESAPDINRAVFDRCPSVANGRIARGSDMDDAVAKALDMVPPGGAVLFSPACASFDMYEDYEDRGRAFKAAVERLSGGAGCDGSR